MASAVNAYVATLFGRDELADCVIVFYQEQANGAEAPPAKRRKTAGTAQPSAPATTLGDPLPAHRMTVFGGSARLRAQAERWTAEQQAGSSKPELRVPLGSPEDLPHALSALRFMYTGKVEGSSAAQLLQVRRQAAYLLVEGCVEACDAALLARVTAGASPQPAGGAASRSPPPLAPVAELFACRHLRPEPAEPGGDALIAALLQACRQQLVLHSGSAATVGAAGQSASLGDLLAWAFRDAPSLLCDPDTRRQMEALPAAAMEALLGSDSFATDDEATVLLVLAEWRAANRAAFARSCDKLCRLVRLSQLSEDYLLGTLSFIPWFPLSREEHGFLCQYVMAAGHASKRTALEQSVVGQYDTASPWYAGGTRPCGRSDLNRPYGWHIKQEDLVSPEGLLLQGSFDNGASRIVSRGFEWRPSVLKKIKDGTAGLVYISCDKPLALGLTTPLKPASLISTSVRLVVHSWSGEGGSIRGVAIAAALDKEEDFTTVESFIGANLLPLASGMQGGGGADTLRRWGAYLREGKLTGSLEFI